MNSASDSLADAPSLVLYGARTGNSFRAAIALEEAGLDYTPRVVKLARGEHRQKPFLRLNPQAKVPVLVVAGADGEADLVLTQSNAIIVFAAEQSDLLPRDGTARLRTLERFLFFVTDVIGLNGAAFQLERQGQDMGAEYLHEASRTAAKVAERFLDGSPFIAGDSFTIADIAALTIIRFMSDKLDWSALPLTAIWLATVLDRPAVIRGLTAFDAE